MTDPDPIMIRIAEAIELGAQGERAAARNHLSQVWMEIGGEYGDPLYRCGVAHAMADLQDDVRQELTWDREALSAADLLTDERAADGGVEGSVRAFYPSLHLNISECYRKLGDVDSARVHLARGLATATALGNDGYGRLIQGALDQLAERLR